MIWLFFSVLTAVLVTFASIVQKKALFTEHAMQFVTVLSIINFFISLPLVFFVDWSFLNAQILGLFWVTSICGAVSFLLIAKALRHMELSSAVPFFVLGPLFTFIVAYFILGETVNFIQLIGVLLILIGAYALEIKGHDFLSPFKEFNKSKYLHYMFWSAIIYGFSSTFDRTLMTVYDIEPFAYIPLMHFLIAVNMIALLSFFHDGYKDIELGFQRAGWWILLVALITVSYRLSQITAISMAAVGLVVSIKRLSILFTIFLGGRLYHEHNLGKKLIWSFVMIMGVIVLGVF